MVSPCARSKQRTSIDEMRAVVETEWPELAHKLPPKNVRG
jgi:hypothetical protein